MSNEQQYPYWPWTVTEDGLQPANGQSEWNVWYGHPRCERPTESEAFLIENRHRIEVMAEWVDTEASYEFEERAILRVGGHFYYVTTSGCSCPSPTEVWNCAASAPSLDELEPLLTQPDAHDAMVFADARAVLAKEAA